MMGIFTLMSTLILKAQVTIGKNQMPNSSAVLDLQSNDSLGLLLPRVALIDTVLASPLPANVPGMFVYNTNTSADGKVVKGIYFNDGRRWWQANSGGAAGPWQLSGTTDVATLNNQDIYDMGQVTIGDSLTVEPTAAMNVVSTDKGLLVPRMTEAQRDSIKSPANGLMVYNTDEDCLNYYTKADTTWNSVCGKLGKATIDSIYCSGLQVFGSYIQGVATTINERLVIPVEVTKAGSYDLTVIAMDNGTPNGYTFTASGTFLYTGKQTITATAQGTPTNANFPPTGTGDNIDIHINSDSIPTCNDFTIAVIPAAADYDITCGSAVVNGVYTMLPDQTNSDNNTHYIAVNVNVNDIGGGTTSGWSAETNKVSGMQFRGSGNFNGTGSQTINLYAVAGSKPTTLDPIVLTMAFQTKNGEVDCQVTMRAAYTPKKIAVFGTADATYGYALNSGQSQGFLSSQANFGSANNSTVKMVDNFTVTPTSSVSGASYVKYGAFAYLYCSTDVNNAAKWTAIINEKVDIVIITYNSATITAAGAANIMNYLNKGGIVLQFVEDNPSQIVSAVFGVPNATLGAARYGSGAWCTLANYADPILSGPFQPDDPDNPGQKLKSLGGLPLFGDTEATLYGITGLPGSGILIYSYNNQTTAGAGLGSVSAFRATGQRFCYFGEGGFFCNNRTSGTPASNIQPFVTTGPPDFRPAVRVVASSGDANYKTQRTAPYSGGYNSFYFGNMMAWAINEAQFYGINAQ